MSLRASAAAGVMQTGVATGAVTVLQVAQLVVIGRLLDDHDLGLYAIMLLATAAVQIAADAGLSAFVVHRQTLDDRGISRLFRANLLLALVVFAGIWMLAPACAAVTGLGELRPLLRAVALIAPVSACGKLFEALLQKELRFGVLGAIQVAASAVGAGATIGLAVDGWGVAAPTAGVLASAAVQNAALLTVGLREHRVRLLAPRIPLGRPWRFALYQLGERTVNLLAHRIDQVLLAALLGTQAVGLYNLLYSLVSLPVQRLNPVLTRVALPVFARVQDRPELLRRGYLVLVNLIMTIDAALLAGLVALAPIALALLFGPERAEHAPLLQTLCFVALQRAIGNPVGSLLLATGRASISFLWNLTLFALSLPTVWIGARLGGAFGVAAGLAVLHLALKVPSYLLLIRPVLGPCARAYLDAVLRPVALASVMAAAVAGASEAAGAAGAAGAAEAGWLALAGLIALGAALYAVLTVAGNRDLARLVGSVTGLGQLFDGRAARRAADRPTD